MTKCYVCDEKSRRSHVQVCADCFRERNARVFYSTMVLSRLNIMLFPDSPPSKPHPEEILSEVEELKKIVNEVEGGFLVRVNIPLGHRKRGEIWDVTIE